MIPPIGIRSHLVAVPFSTSSRNAKAERLERKYSTHDGYVSSDGSEYMNHIAAPHFDEYLCFSALCVEFMLFAVERSQTEWNNKRPNNKYTTFGVHVIDFFSRRARSRHHIRFTSISRSIRCTICFLRSFHVFGVFHAMHSSARFPLLAFSAEYKFLIHVFFFFLVRPQQRLSNAVLLALFSFHIFVFVSFILTSVHDHMVSVI